VGRYRSSIALAGSGLLIAIFLIAKGPTLGDKGTGPLRAAAEGLDTKQRELAAAVEARATTLAQLPRLAWAVATDEETVRDLTTDELGFRTQPGEMIALAQIDKASGRAVTLLHAPPTATLGAPLTAAGAHAIIVGGELLVARVVAVEPRERTDAVTGALVVARKLDVSGAADQLIRAGIAARIVTSDGSATLTEVPALARQPEITISIGASSGMSLVARLPSRKGGVWIALGIFVLLIWGGAAAMAARQGGMRAAGVVLPTTVALPPPFRNGVAPSKDLPDTTPMLDLAIAQRNITASSNGFHANGVNGVHGAAVSPVIEIVSGPVAVGVPHTEAMPASSANFPALFREFMDLRKRCGDRSAAPSYDEFFKLLEKRRREMLATRSASDVMFQIVFIDGRAVVRAKGVN
jgi:hypothetical protein